MIARREIRKPERRECEQCGRIEVWDEDRVCWRIAIEDDEKFVGNAFCIHEWDIDGTFRPFQ